MVMFSAVDGAHLALSFLSKAIMLTGRGELSADVKRGQMKPVKPECFFFLKNVTPQALQHANGNISHQELTGTAPICGAVSLRLS